MQGFAKISKFLTRTQNKKTRECKYGAPDGTEYVQRGPHARFALATRLLFQRKINLKWGLRNIKKEDIINFQI